MPELKKKQGNRCTNFMRRNSALSCYSLSNCTGIDQNRTKMEDTEHLQLCLCLSLIYSRAKNASNGILNSETPFESKCYMSMTTAEEMLGCACFLACKMRNTDCTHTHTHTLLPPNQLGFRTDEDFNDNSRTRPPSESFSRATCVVLVCNDAANC